jgi:hypothetical protein
LSTCSVWDLFIEKYEYDDEILVPREWSEKLLDEDAEEWIYTSDRLLQYLSRTSYLEQRKQYDRVTRRQIGDDVLKARLYSTEDNRVFFRYRVQYRYLVKAGGRVPDFMMKQLLYLPDPFPIL